MSKNQAPYTLQSPCADCPFRTDVGRYLRPERAQEIANSMTGPHGADFTCHKTVDYIDTPDGGTEARVGKRGRTCAGSMVILEKQNKPTQAMRIAERLGMYDRERLDMEAPVYDSLDEWVRSYRDDQSGEPCDVAGPDCTAPAGWMRGTEVVTNHGANCTESCADCGDTMCDECSAGGLCIYCAKQDEDEG